MTEKEAQRELKKMLKTLTLGGLLHLIADIYRSEGKIAEKKGDELRHEQCQKIEATLVVVGAGCDASLPS